MAPPYQVRYENPTPNPLLTCEATVYTHLLINPYIPLCSVLRVLCGYFFNKPLRVPFGFISLPRTQTETWQLIHKERKEREKRLLLENCVYTIGLRGGGF
jgi:hypothetical protein